MVGMDIFSVLAIFAGLVIAAGALMYLLLRLSGEGEEQE